MVLAAAAAIWLVCGLLVLAGDGDANEESEREVKESEVPAAALSALRKLAAGATLTEFAEEVEHGHKFYEGSWKGKDGNVDGLVTESGDVVEIEEMIPDSSVPSAVRAELAKAFGSDARIEVERKTLVVYEGHFSKGGKEVEMLLTPDGRPYHEEGGGADNDEDGRR
jgi:hypothetical protein